MIKKKLFRRIIAWLTISQIVFQPIFPAVELILMTAVSAKPVLAGDKCDGWADPGSEHRNAGNGCFYRCDGGGWSGPTHCDGQGNGQFQGEAAQNEEDRRRQEEAVRQREQESQTQIAKQSEEETRRVAEETSRQRVLEEQKQREMAAAQLAAARAEADRIAAENTARAQALREEAERRAREAAQKIEAITPQLPAATVAPTAVPTTGLTTPAGPTPTPTATPTPAANVPGQAGDKAWGDCKLAGGSDADCTKKAQDAYIAQEHQETVKYIEAGKTSEDYYQDNLERKQKDAVNGQIAGEVVRQLNAAGRSTSDLSQAEYDRIQQIIHLDLPQAEALNTALGQNPAEISQLVSAGLGGGTAVASAAVREILQATGVAATATPTVSSTEVCLQAGGCIGGFDGKTCLPGGTVSRDGILVCQNGSWLVAVSLTPTVTLAATATPGLTASPTKPPLTATPAPTAAATPKPTGAPSCSWLQWLNGTCRLTPTPTSAGSGYPGAGGGRDANRPPPTPQLAAPAAGGYAGFFCQGKTLGQEFSGPGGYRFVCDTYTSVPRAVSSPAAFLPTPAVKPEICRPGIRRLPDGSCVNPTPLPTLAVQPTVAEKLLFDTVTYECRGDVSVTTVRSLLGAFGGSPAVTSETPCNWGCVSGKCQGPTAEKWEHRLRETYNVVVERELGKPLADATEQEISQAYDEVSDINYWKMTGSSPSVLEGDPMSTTIKDLYNDPPLTEAQLEAVVEWKTDELTRTAVQEGALVGERECGPYDRKCFRDLAEKEVERILESYGGLSPTHSDALTGDSPQFNAMANLSAVEAKAQVDAQQTLYGKIVADAMFEDLNPAYRAAFHRDDLISVNWNRDQWASILTGQGILGSVIGSMGQEKLGVVQQPVVMENAVKFCGLSGGETQLTQEQLACYIASSIAVKANLDTYETQRLQNVLLTAAEAAAGIASGGTLVATLPVAMALAPAQTLVNTQGIAAMAEVRGAFATAAEEELADLKSRKAGGVQVGDEQLAQAEAAATQAREQANQAKEQYAAEYWAQLPINAAMAGGGELAGEGLSVVGKNFFRYWRGVGKAGAEGVAEEIAEAAAETAARAGVDLPSQPKLGALAQQIDDLAVGVEVVAGGKPPDVTVPAVVAGVDTVPVGGAVAEAAAAIAEVKGPGLGARIGAAWDGSAWNKGNWRPRTITVEPGGRVGGMFEMGIVDTSGEKLAARIFPEPGKPVLVGGEEIMVPPTGGINVYPGETVSVGGRTVTVIDISADGSVGLTAEPYRPFGGLFGGGRQAAKEGGEAVAEVAAPVAKEAPPAAVKPPAEIVPEVKPPHIPFSDRVSNLLDSVLPERTIARNADNLIAESGGKQGLYQEIVRAVGGAESQPTIAAARRSSQQAVLDFVDVRSKALGLNLSPEQVSSVSRKLYDDLNLEQGLDYLTKTQPAVVNGGVKVIDYKGQDAAALVKGSDLPDIGKVDTMGIIADGHGNQREGKIAAQTAKEQFAGFYLHHVSKGKNPKEAIRAAIGDLDNVITNEMGPAGHGGTTFTVAVQKGNELYVGNVGDSRLYLIDGQTGNIRQVTVDHNWPGGERRYGILVSRSLGDLDIKTISKGKFSSRPDIFGPFPVKEGDMVVMGSDSLEKLGRILGGENNLERTLVEIATSLNPNQAASSLAELALKNGVKDDIGVVVMRVDSVGGKAIGLELPVFEPEDRGILRRLFGIGEPAGIVAPGAKAINDAVGGIRARFGRGDSLDDLVGPAGAIHTPEFLADVRPDPILENATRTRPETGYTNQLKGYLDENPIRFALDADGNRIPVEPEDVAKLKEVSRMGLQPDEISAKIVTPEGEQPTLHLDDLFECNPISIGFRLVPQTYAASRGPCPVDVFQSPTVVRPDGSSEDLITTEDIGGGGFGKVQRTKLGEVAKTAFDEERSSYLSAERRWLDRVNRRGFGDILPQVTGEIRDGSGRFIGFTMTEIERAVTLAQWPYPVPDDISSGFLQRLAGLDDAGLLHRDVFPKNVMVVLEPDPSLAKGFRPNKLVLIDPIKPVGGEITHAFLDPDGSLAQSYLRGGHYQTRTLANGALAIIVPENNVVAAKALINQHNFTVSSPESFQFRNPLSDKELRGVAENTILPKYDRVPVDELPTDNPASTTRDEIRSVKNTSGTDLERTTDDAADALGIPCNPFTFRFIPQAYAGSRDPCPITLLGPNNPAVKVGKAITQLFGGEELPVRTISAADENIAETIQPFFKAPLSDSPRSTVGRIRGGTTTATAIGDPANPKGLVLESQTTGLVTIKPKVGEELSDTEIQTVIRQLKDTHPNGFAVTNLTQEVFGSVLEKEGFIANNDGRLFWIPDAKPRPLSTLSSGYTVLPPVEKDGIRYFSVVQDSQTAAAVSYDPTTRTILGVQAIAGEETAAITIVASQLSRQPDFAGVAVSQTITRDVSLASGLRRVGFIRTPTGVYSYLPELISQPNTFQKIGKGLVTFIGLAGILTQVDREGAVVPQETKIIDSEDEKPIPQFPDIEIQRGDREQALNDPVIANMVGTIHTPPRVEEKQTAIETPIRSQMDSVSKLENIAESYVASTEEEAIEVARGIDFIPSANFEDPSNMCGPLAISILRDAGIIKNDIDVSKFWLLNPRVDTKLIEETFPQDQFSFANYNIPISQYNFSSNPLKSGDLLYLFAGPRDNFEHVLSVTRIDDSGRAYSVTNVRLPSGEMVITEVMLYDPERPGEGQFYKWGTQSATGLTGGGGFSVWRKNDSAAVNPDIIDDNREQSMLRERISAAGGRGSAGFAGEGLSEESQIQKQQTNHRQTEGNSSLEVKINDGIAKISDDWLHDSNFLNMNATNKQIVANKKLIVNNANLNLGLRLGSGVITMPAMNQPAERLTNQSDAKANQISTGRNIIKSVAAIQSIVNQLVSAAGGGFMPQVYAAEGGGGRIMPLSMYRALAGQILVKKVMESLPAEDRTTEKLAEAVLAAGTLVNALPERGTLTEADGIITGITGTRGIAAGAAAKGIYRVQVDPIAGVDFIVPETVEVGPGGTGVAMIGVTKGKGRIKFADETSIWEKLIGKIIPGARAQTQNSAIASTVPLTVQLFHDKNKNGRQESGELSVQWAGVKVVLAAATETVSYQLNQGWNFVAFPVVPESVKTAADLIQDAALDGGYVTTVATWEGDKWLEFSQRGAEKFGQDFELTPGRGYFLNSHQDSVWTLAGIPLPEEKQVLQLRKGWNGVGLPVENTTTAVQILDEIQSASEVSQTSPCEVCETADQMARWDFGLWDVVVKRRYSAEQHEIYGRDFPIKDTEGYFIHANKDIRFQ